MISTNINQELMSSRDVSDQNLYSESSSSSQIFLGQNEDLWNEAVDQLLQWRDDSFDINIMDSAIDLAVDFKDAGWMSPSSMMVSEDDEVVFEWRVGNIIFIIEVMESGFAECTKYENLKVIDEYVLERNPITRRLEVTS